MAIWLVMVPLGQNNPASCPNSCANFCSSFITVGSSLKTSSPTSYSCKLIISGKSISTNDQDKFNNILSDYNAQQRTNKSISNLSKFKLKDTKENNDPFSCSSNNKTNEYDQTIESSNKSNADFDYSLINTRKIIIKTENT